MHFDLPDLRLFVHIAEEKNLTRGARRACLSPAAASARLKALEAQLGSRLLYRESHGVMLSAAGDSLLHHARLILRQVEQLKSEFSDHGADAVGAVRIFANTTAVTEFMPEVLAEFLAIRPAVTIDLQERLTRDIFRGVQDGASDFGIVSGPVPDLALQVIPFSSDRLVMVAALNHPLSRQRRMAFSDALDYPQISLHEGSTLHAFLCELFQQHGRALAPRVQVRSFEAMCRMIEAGVGIGLLPESAALRHQQSMRLHIIEMHDAWAPRERSILVRELDALPACARALVSAILHSSYSGKRPVPTPESKQP